ncbi:MAG TPA: type VI secretion system domain-containing protein [Polyangiales bacterium]|nr:type VI secretion system domain-containing protein [Polyangiales bacterium]
MAMQMLKRKLELDPDPIEVAPVAEAGASGDGSGSADGTSATGGALAAEPVSREDASSRVVSAARYIRQTDPFNPASYLLLRGLRWGELRVGGVGVDPKLLEAPPTSVRTRLKGLLLDAKWHDLLEVAEGVMGTPQGRGWMDLQRYALTACEALGNEYDAVASGIRGALKALLSDLPALLDMTMMDDTPTANAETRTWITSRILDGVQPQPRQPRSSVEIAAMPELPGRDPFSIASAEVRAGRADRAISLLMKEVSRQKTSRARFLTQVQLAHVMVEAGHNAVAMPVLEQLLAAIESHKLEEWEAGEVVAEPLGLMYRALVSTEGDESQRQELYLRICRLDPLAAIGFSH